MGVLTIYTQEKTPINIFFDFHCFRSSTSQASQCRLDQSNMSEMMIHKFYLLATTATTITPATTTNAAATTTTSTTSITVASEATVSPATIINDATSSEEATTSGKNKPILL